MQANAARLGFARSPDDERRLAWGALVAAAVHGALLGWAAAWRHRPAPELVESRETTASVELDEWTEPTGGDEPEGEPSTPTATKPEVTAPAPRATPPRVRTERLPKTLRRHAEVPRFAPPSIATAGARLAKSVAAPGNSRARQRRGPGLGGGGLFGSGQRAGNGPGSFRASICFIPESTRSLATVDDCETVYERYIDEINVPARRFEDGFPGFEDRTEWFAVHVTGRFRVSVAGTHRFRLKSDDGALLYVDGHLIVDNDGIHGTVSKRGEVELAEGVHQFRVRYFQGMKYELALQLFVTPPGRSERLFRANL